MSGSSLSLLYCQLIVEERLERRLHEAQDINMVRAAHNQQHRGPHSAVAKLKAALVVLRRAAVRSVISPSRS